MTSQPYRPKWILYADTNYFLLRLFSDFFNVSGYYIHSCADGLTASAALAAPVHFDLLRLAAELPRIDGLELVKKARELPSRKETPIIVFSLEDRHDEALAAGATQFVRKPSDLFALVDAAKRLLAAS